MAVRESAKSSAAGTKRAWFVAACLVVLFVAALFLRAYWNLDAANPSEGEFILSGGSDPYYHKRAVDAIQASGFQHLLSDPLLNYPRGSENPNPPLYEWFIAVGGQLLAPLFGGDVVESTWQVTIWSPAIFGALTLIPIYYLGAILFDRRAGLIAALLWTVSTSAIDATGVGLADHDAMVLFFASLAFLFYIQTIRHFRGEGNWIARWSDGGAISSGLSRLFRERSRGFAFALLTAVSIAGVALTWKGFNYVVGIIGIYAGAMMIVDHFRNRDSTGLFLGTLVALVVGVILAYPYYSQAGVANFLQPTWFLLGGFIVAGLVLVPTRDLPSILVLPAVLLVGAAALAVAFFVVPEVAQSLLYATVYFKQTRLYETIAEAHPADFSTITFGIGPLPFFLAIAGWFVLLFRIAAKPTQAWLATGGFLTLALVAYVLTSPVAEGALALPLVGAVLLTWLIVMFSLGDSPVGRMHAFAIVWAAVALFMAQSAVRFLINAIPVFAVFAGFMAVWVLDWLDFSSIRKSLAANRGNFWQGLRKGTRPLHVVAVALIALLFVFPTTMLAADAALPPEAEDRLAGESDSEFVRNFFQFRMGAYGGGFGSVKPWIPALEWLQERDANISDPAARPGFLAWWDYGHWAIAIGEHPAVADNFQNGYEMAANFILSQNEAHAIQLIASRLAEAPSADLEAALREVGVEDVDVVAAKIRAWEFVEDLSVAESDQLVQVLEQQTGKSIRYFATDIRMLPYDNPQTGNIDQSSIFYAPVRLKGDNPDDYVTTQVNLGQPVPGAPDGHVTVDQYKELASDPVRQYSPLGERFVYQPEFFNSMYWRAYVGTQPPPEAQEPILGTAVESALGNPRPTAGLEHFRPVYVGEIQRLYKGGDPTDPSSYIYYPGVMIVEYFHGAVVEGVVAEDGQPLSGVTVTAFDDTGRLLADAFQSTIDPSAFNVAHGTAVTDEQGRFRLNAPFAMPGGAVTLIASRDGVQVGNATLAITREQAAAREVISGVEIGVERGAVEGFAFRDVDGDGQFNETTDQRAADVPLTIGDVTVTTGADGAFLAEDVSAGVQNVTTTAEGLQVGVTANRVVVQPGETVTHNVALEPQSARVSGRLVADIDESGAIDDVEGVPFQTITFAADENVTDNTARTVTAFTEQSGNYTVALQPGTYVATATYTDRATGDVYTLEETLTVAAGEVVTDRELVMVKQAE